MNQDPSREDRGLHRNRSISLPHLRELRQSKGLSQRELGKLARVSSGTVYRLENELRGAYPTTVRKLAVALETTPAALVDKKSPRR